MSPTGDWTDIATARFIKDDLGSYGEHVIEVAKGVNANLILISLGGSTRETDKWNWQLIPEFVRRCREDGLRVAFYTSLTNINWKSMFNEQPEAEDWIMRYQDGTPALYGGNPERYMGCLNNPGWRQHLKDQIRAAVEYDADALFYDNCFIPSVLTGSREEGVGKAWACYCDACGKLLESYTEETLGWKCALPIQPDWDDPVWQAFIKFRDKSFVNAVRMVVDYAHELKPDIVVYPNVCPPWFSGGGAKGSATNQVSKVVDLLLFEKRGTTRLDTPPEAGRGTRRPITAAVDWKYGAALKGTPVWYRMNAPGGNHDYTPDQVRIGMAEASSFGGAYHNIFATVLAGDKEKAEGVKGHYAFLEQNQQYYSGVRPVADVAILVSMSTINWYLPDNVAQGGELPVSIQGFAQALVELHIPFNVVTDEDMAKRELDYRVLVLPNVACMSDQQAQAVARFVERGGSLVASSDTSLYDDDYRIRNDHALAEVFGVHHGQEADGIVKNRFGQGLSAYLPRGPEDEFWKRGLPAALGVIEEAMAYALRDDWQVRIDAPPTTVTNITETSGTGTTLLHLVNFETPRRREGISVKLRRPEGRSLSSATLLSPDFEGAMVLEARQGAKTVSFTVPRLEVYTLAVIDWK